MQTELCEKTSTQVYKRCSHCKEYKPPLGFQKNRCCWDGLHRECKVCKGIRDKEYYVRNRDRELRRATEYRHSEQGKKLYAIYRHSEKGRAAQWRFKHSEKGRASILRYNYSDTARMAGIRYEQAHPNRWGRSAEYRRDLFQRMQDDVGLHCSVSHNYPLFRLLKGLMNAEIVEVKR